MNSVHKKTLAAIFSQPVPSALEWRKIESLLLAVGAELVERNGSRVRFAKGEMIATFHRPHPQKEAKPYQVRDAAPGARCKNFFDVDRNTAMNPMMYKGYAARVEYSDEDACFVGHIAGISDIVGFHADTVAGLKAAFSEAVDDYLATAEQLKRAPKKPYSGKLMLRLPPEVHARAAMMAEATGKSINAWATEVLARGT